MARGSPPRQDLSSAEFYNVVVGDIQSSPEASTPNLVLGPVSNDRRSIPIPDYDPDIRVKPSCTAQAACPWSGDSTSDQLSSTSLDIRDLPRPGPSETALPAQVRCGSSFGG